MVKVLQTRQRFVCLPYSCLVLIIRQTYRFVFDQVLCPDCTYIYLLPATYSKWRNIWPKYCHVLLGFITLGSVWFNIFPFITYSQTSTKRTHFLLWWVCCSGVCIACVKLGLRADRCTAAIKHNHTHISTALADTFLPHLKHGRKHILAGLVLR